MQRREPAAELARSWPRRAAPRSIHSSARKRGASGSSATASTLGHAAAPAARRASAGRAPRRRMPGAASGGGLHEHAPAVVELGGVGVVEVAAADRAAAHATPAPSARASASRSPGTAAQLVEQPAAGGLDEVEHVLEAVGRRRSTGRARRGRRAAPTRVELAQQPHLRRARSSSGAIARRSLAFDASSATQEVEVARSPRAAPGAPRRSSAIPRARGRGHRARVGRIAHVPAAGAGAVDLDRVLEPGLATSPRITPSAVGERQMLPMQTNRMRSASRRGVLRARRRPGTTPPRERSARSPSPRRRARPRVPGGTPRAATERGSFSVGKTSSLFVTRFWTRCTYDDAIDIAVRASVQLARCPPRHAWSPLTPQHSPVVRLQRSRSDAARESPVTEETHRPLED